MSKTWKAGEEVTADKLNGTGLGLHVVPQSTPAMTLSVKEGVAFIGGILVKVATQNTPSFTAPVGNPRIDIVTLDNTGVVAITQGTAAGSPVPPAYPTDKLVLAEIYLKASCTSITAEDTGVGTQGYVYRDSRPVTVGSPAGNFGDGSDGTVNMDGTNTFAAFATKSSMVYTLTRSVYATTLTIGAGVTLDTGGFQIFASVQINGSGIVRFNGNNGGNGVDGSGSTGGAGGVGGTTSGGFFKTTPGGNGGPGGNQNASAGAVPATTAQIRCAGTTGSKGGNGGAAYINTGNLGAVGANGSTCTIARKIGVLKSDTLTGITADSTGVGIYVAQGMAGGGGGGGGRNYSTSCSGGGGGGGASGGIVWIAAAIWAGTFTIQALGGTGGNAGNNGGAAPDDSGGAGSGAGGNGGLSVVIYGSKSWTGSYQLSGGVGGTPKTPAYGTAGATGATGAAGTSYEFPITNLL